MKLVKEVNGKKIILTPMNSATLKLETTGVITEICYSNTIEKDILSITINEDYRITKYGGIKIPSEDRDVLYEINHIIQISAKEFLLLSELRNRTTTYLLPSLGYLPLTNKIQELNRATQQEISKYCINTYLINAYLTAEKLNLIELVYRFSNHSTYKLLEECLINHPGFIKTVDGYKKDDYVAFRLEIPLDFVNDVSIFLKGAYSELSPQLKTMIVKFHRAHKKTRLYQILYKKKELKEELEKDLGVKLSSLQELDSIPDRDHEFIEIR